MSPQNRGEIISIATNIHKEQKNSKANKSHILFNNSKQVFTTIHH